MALDNNNSVANWRQYQQEQQSTAAANQTAIGIIKVKRRRRCCCLPLPVATVVTIQEQQLLQQQQEQLEPPHTDGNRNSRHSTDQRAEHAVNGAAYASVLRLSCIQHTHTFRHTHAQKSLPGQLFSWSADDSTRTTTTRELATLLAVLCRRRSPSHPLAVFAFGQLLINLPHRARSPANSFERILFLCCCPQQQQRQRGNTSPTAKKLNALSTFLLPPSWPNDFSSTRRCRPRTL